MFNMLIQDRLPTVVESFDDDDSWSYGNYYCDFWALARRINKYLNEKKTFFGLAVGGCSGFSTAEKNEHHEIVVMLRKKDCLIYSFKFYHDYGANHIIVTDHKSFRYQMNLNDEGIFSFADILIRHMTFLNNEIRKLELKFNINTWHSIAVLVPTSKYKPKYKIQYEINNEIFRLMKHDKIDRNEIDINGNVYRRRSFVDTEIKNSKTVDSLIQEIINRNPELENTSYNRFRYSVGILKIE